MRALTLLLLVLFAGPALAETASEPPPGKAVATFAGGCFWCVEEAFDGVDGVESTTSGYTGGDTVDPTYEQVTAGDTGHAEAVRVVYDPGIVSYRRLLDVFWHNIDPTVENRQFCDVGSQYRSAIFYHDEDQRRLARETRTGIEESGVLPGPVKTEIVPADLYRGGVSPELPPGKSHPLQVVHERMRALRPAGNALGREGPDGLTGPIRH